MIPGQSYAYGYDSIGNREITTVNGRFASYSANLRNEYVEREVPGAVDVYGWADPDSTVTVNSLSTTRLDGWFYRELTFANGSADRWESVTVEEDSTPVHSGHVFLAKDMEEFDYDDDGNLIMDGRFEYTWDGENRLVKVETRADLHSSVPRRKVEFVYDYLGRRAAKTVSTWSGSSYGGSTHRRFVWIGWTLIAEIDEDDRVIERTYLWGPDLAEQRSPRQETPHRSFFGIGAGGVGGLLAVTLHGGTAVTHPVSHDANGNVVAVGLETHFEYDPFGNLIRATGPLVGDMPFRFSTKYHDTETGLYNYGYRYYSPSMGRFFNRDPIEERGGLNLYGFVGNDPLSAIDYLGKYPVISTEEAEGICCDLTGKKEFQVIQRECYRWYDDQGEPWPDVTLRQTCISCVHSKQGEGKLHLCEDGTRTYGTRRPLRFTWDERVEDFLSGHPEGMILSYYENEHMLCTPLVVD